ncbi:hypothetical protein ABIB86_000418 [Bradyrhizobium sp. JR1.7]|uniref:hypothetical protein n=1 Tax=unclassified Bradyrhizobium TaxID=2631580 RepID=UPI003392BD83
MVDISRFANLTKLNRKNRRILKLNLLSEFTSTPGSGNTITSAADTADGAYAGGEIITMALTTGNTANQNKIAAVAASPFPAVGSGVTYFATMEMKVALGTFLYATISDAVPNNLVYMQVGLSDNQVTMKAPGAADLVVSPPNWDMSQWFRLTCAVVPTGTTSYKVYYYLHYKSTATSTEAQYYIGTQTIASSNIIPTTFTVKNGSTGAVGSATITKPRIFELLGVILGCSTDAGYVGWCPDPNTARTFAANTYNESRNPGIVLGRELNGDSDMFLTHARGGFLVEDMAAGQANWATVLNPAVTVIGSATNSLISALANYTAGSARDTYIASVQALYLGMVQAALATGSIVLCQGVTPRSDTAVTGISGGVAALRTITLNWNAWMKSTLIPLGAFVTDPYSAFEDPNSLGTMLAAYDAGDHVHFSWAGHNLLGSLRQQALAGF